MARIRLVEISNFRGIKELSWLPAPGINCLIGPGDSGKSTLLDAIDLCLGARRTYQFVDADFYNLDISSPIDIQITLGDLSDSLRNLDAYGLYLRGFNSDTEEIRDEPDMDCEAAITLRLHVGRDLEPVWSIRSDRADAQDQTRNLAWNDRLSIAPTRLGATSSYNLAWRRGSVLNKLSDERPDVSAALVSAARNARNDFGVEADKQLKNVLDIVTEAVETLGLPVDGRARAMLDVHSVSFGGGTISLHDQVGIPLQALGTGSSRLLTASLQYKAASASRIAIVDEIEYGLEPHRVIQFLDSIGVKEKPAQLQCFLATHSPVVLQELSGDQLFVVRKHADKHEVQPIGTSDEVQGTIRKHPEAFLASAIIVCEGATEIGFIRGLDQIRARKKKSLTARGVALVDGGGVDQLHKRSIAFNKLGYRTAVLRDDDKAPDSELESAFLKAGILFKWRPGRATEDEIFLSVSEAALLELINQAEELYGSETINSHIKSASDGALDTAACRQNISDEVRRALGKAARSKKGGWFKSISLMQTVTAEVIAPEWKETDEVFRASVSSIFSWIDASGN